MNDKIEKFYNSVIHHGKDNNRAYLMKLDTSKVMETIDYIENLALKELYTKIIAKVPKSKKAEFENRNFISEAFIEKFFKGEENTIFFAKYLFEDEKRQVLQNKEEVNKIIAVCKAKEPIKDIFLPKEYNFEILKEKDIPLITKLYKSVFKTYPFPVFSDDYILSTMKDHVVYFGIKKQGELVAISSAEMDKENLNAEMTDFATHLDYRGLNLSLFLLKEMEDYLKSIDFKTAYTIARSISYGMNITFAKNNYVFGGTLINNTNISGDIESMNIWYKTL